MIRLVCIDVDGTLVGSSRTVLPAVWVAAERARARGVHLAVCTGRPGFGDAFDYASRLDGDGWHVFQNGASVVRPSTGLSLSTTLPPDAAPMLIDRARTSGRILELYTDLEYAIESTSPRAREHARLLGVPFNPRPFESLPGPYVRAQWLADHSEEASIATERYPGLELSSSTSPVMPDTLFVNMTASGVDKGSAVRTVAADYGISLDDVMFVGDGNNDLGAMQAVGYPVAMANADASVLAIVRHVVGHVDDGGLAEALDLAGRPDPLPATR
jgi:Cof subfamily protein (haloacid dehalogenase superfamily)